MNKHGVNRNKHGVHRVGLFRRRTLAGIAALSLIAAVAGCGGGDKVGPAKSMTLAYQNGIGYAPMVIVKQKGWLEDELSDTEFKWKLLGSGAAMRDAMISDQVQAGTLGVPPYLVGLDKGVKWKYLISMADVNFWLVSNKKNIRSLKDFKPSDKISTVAPDSIHAIALRKNAADQLGDAHALDKNLVALPHPDGYQAVITGQTAAYYGSPPFQGLAVEKGAHKITDSNAAFGSTNFAGVVMKDEFHENNPEIANALFKAVNKAFELIKNDPGEAARTLAAADKNTTEAAYRKQLDDEAVKFGPKLNNWKALANFMKEIGITKSAPTKDEDVMFKQLTSLE